MSTTIVPVKTQQSIKLIADAPTPEDDFSSHEPIAQSLALLIRQEEGGKTIGLEGGWGTGKSSIIVKLKKLLVDDNSQNTDTAFIVYDAWAHQGDPLRRSILETLINELLKIGWITDKDEKWTNKKEELARRRKTEKIKSTLKVTLISKIIAISLIFSSVGSSVLSAIDKENYVFVYTDLILFHTFSKLLIISPVIVLLVFGIICCVKYIKREKVDFRILENESTTEQITNTIETPDPTSLEFYAYFKELMEDACPKNSNHKIVLVIDNLDRVEADDALAIWATLRTFLECSEHKPPEWFKQLWTIIPYDRHGLQNLWKGEETPLFDSLNGVSYDRSQPASVDAFLDKTFDTRIYVPPVVLSKWEAYLGKLLNEVFKEIISEEDVHNIFMVYENLGNNSDTPTQPTPRELKLFVNELSMLRGVWYSRPDAEPIPLKHMAYFIRLKRNTTTSINQFCLAKREKEPDFLVERYGKEIYNHVNALHYNLPIQAAQQALLKQPITDAIEHEEIEKLKDLSAIDGFWRVFQGITISSFMYNPGGIERYYKFSKALIDTGFIEIKCHPVEESVDAILKAAKGPNLGVLNLSVPDFYETNAKMVLPLIKLANSVQDNALIDKIFKDITTSGLFDHDDFDAIAESSTGFYALLTGVENIDPSLVAGRVLSLNLPSLEILLTFSTAFQQDPQSKQYLQNIKPQKVPKNLFLTSFKEHSFSSEHLKLIDFLTASTSFNAGEFFKNLEPVFFSEAFQYEPEELDSIYNAIKSLQNKGLENSDFLKSLITKKVIFAHYERLSQVENEFDKTKVYLNYLYFKYKNNENNYKSLAVKETDFNGDSYGVRLAKSGFTAFKSNLQKSELDKNAFAKEFIDLLLDYNELELLLSVLEDDTQTFWEFVTCCIQHLLSLDKPDLVVSLFTPENYVKHWDFLNHANTLSGEELDQLTTLLLKKPDLETYITGSLNYADCDKALLARVIISESASKSIKRFAYEGLEQHTAEEWQNLLLSEETDEYKLLVSLLNASDYTPHFGEPYRTALLHCVQRAFENVSPAFWGNYSLFLKGLNDSSLKNYQKTLLPVVVDCAEASAIPEEILELLKPALSDPIEEDIRGNRVQTITLWRHAIANLDQKLLEFLKTFLSTIQEQAQQLETLKALIERNLTSAEASDFQAVLHAIAQEIGIELPQPEDSEEGSEGEKKEPSDSEQEE